MAQVNPTLLKQWQDGEVMHGPDYNRERDLLVAAYNDTQKQVDALKSTTVPAIGTGNIQDGAVTEPKIGNGAVTNSKLGSKSVTNDKLADNSVAASQLQSNSVTSTKIESGAVTNTKLADNSVSTAKIQDGAVTSSKLADNSVTGPRIAASSVSSSKIASDAISDEKLQAGAVSTPKIRDSAVTSSKLADGAVTPTKIVKDAVTQYTYDQATIDARIAASVSGAIPQEVIDQIREDVDSSVTDLQNRLNNDSRWNATLNPGRSIINSYKSAKFDLSSLKGRTLLNQLGRLGRFGQGTFVVGFFGTTNTSIVTSGGVNSLRVELTGGTSGTGGPSLVVPIPSGEYFVAVGDIMVDAASSMSAAVGVQGAFGSTVTDFSTYRPSFLRFTRAVTGGDSRVGLFVQGSVGSYALMRDLRVYKITQAEYDALATMSPEAVAAKYPYVDDMRPVRNPYVLRYGTNLLPQFSEWKVETGKRTVTGPYTVDLSKTTTGFNTVSTTAADVVPGADYIFQTTVEVSNISGTVGNGAYFAIHAYDKNGSVVGTNMAAPPYATVNGPHTLKATFKAPIDAVYVKVSLSVSTGALGNFVFKNPRLNLGTVLSGDFQPREDVMLALQTDLNANPYTGADADEVFEENGQYFKLAKWRGMSLDGSISYAIIAAKPYLKWIRFPIPGGPNVYDVNMFAMAKYNGYLIDVVPGSLPAGVSPDQIDYDPGDKYLYLSISNSDSGWGDRDLVQTYSGVAANRTSYVITPPAGTAVIKVNNVLINNIPYANWSLSGSTVMLEVAPTAGSTVTINYVATYVPTVDEIKAYFMGYKMYPAGGSGSDIYTGSGTKAWVYRTPSGLDGWQDVGITLPTSPAPTNAYWTPYQLVYQLATPTVEPIVSEGMLTFNEGDNQIEVGTGIVVRESAKPSKSASGTMYTINTSTTGGVDSPSPLRNLVGSILRVFKNSTPDTTWELYNTYQPNGKVRAVIANANYDPSAAYSVTYLMLDSLPVNPITGSYSTSENAMLRSLTETVQQNATAISALMQRKVEKDAPVVWIEPTLLNGAATYPDQNFRKPSYAKIDTWVKLSGLISPPSTGGLVIFRLPEGYRPNKYLIFVCKASGTLNADVRIFSDGSVIIQESGLDWVSLDNVMFPAER